MAAILLWVLFYRSSTWWLMGMAITTTILAIAGFLVAVAGIAIKSSMVVNEMENSFLTSLALIISSIATGFLVVGALFLVLMMPIQFGCVVCGKANDSQWRGYIESWTA